ncbi:tRNA pseudouridine synthase A [Xanthomonas sp. Mitacek01]|nr:tRNA pseudouridine synthase A [Xanthomonas sp. Mitacek01]
MRYAIGVEYDGHAFHGWQRLSRHGETGAPSVQEALEDALSKIANHPVTTVCSGRTDAGVHAQCQVVHFDSDAPRAPRAWVLGTTTLLPPQVGVLWCQPVADGFNARFDARARHYRYRILNRQVRPALHRHYLSWELRPLDADAMHRAAQALLGEQDFSAFRTVQCQAKHPHRDLQRIRVRRDGDEVIVDVQANAFLHHMVRNIVGSLLEVGAGVQPEAWIGDLLAGRDRNLAGPTAPAAGLVFLGPLYPPEWNLPAAVTLSGVP